MALTACTPAIPGESGGGGDSSKLTMLLPDTVNSIDPALAFSTGGRQATWLIYEALVGKTRRPARPFPDSRSRGTSRRCLPPSSSRRGAMCADGSEITAGTVARNFERWKDP